VKGKQKVFVDGLMVTGEKVYLGLDPSYTGFGLAVLSEGGSYMAYTYESAGTGVDRLIDIDDWLFGTLSSLWSFTIENAAIEGYAMAARYGREMAGELGGVVRTCMRLHPLASQGAARYPMVVSPQGLKKYVLGPGKGTGKALMLKGVYKRWGVDLNDDNAADAYALARIASGHVVEKYQQEVVDKAKATQ
jgi:hypothetical protein